MNIPAGAASALAGQGRLKVHRAACVVDEVRELTAVPETIQNAAILLSLKTLLGAVAVLAERVADFEAKQVPVPAQSSATLAAVKLDITTNVDILRKIVKSRDGLGVPLAVTLKHTEFLEFAKLSAIPGKATALKFNSPGGCIINGRSVKEVTDFRSLLTWYANNVKSDLSLAARKVAALLGGYSEVFSPTDITFLDGYFHVSGCWRVLVHLYNASSPLSY